MAETVIAPHGEAFSEVRRLLAEHDVILRRENKGTGLLLYGLWMLLPRAWEPHPRGWLHVLSYAPFLKKVPFHG